MFMPHSKKKNRIMIMHWTRYNCLTLINKFMKLHIPSHCFLYKGCCSYGTLHHWVPEFLPVFHLQPCGIQHLWQVQVAECCCSSNLLYPATHISKYIFHLNIVLIIGQMERTNITQSYTNNVYFYYPFQLLKQILVRSQNSLSREVWRLRKVWAWR